MTGDIVLSGALRTNLASLSSTQTLIDQTNQRLSTGRKVNAELDNPQAFFAASSLSERPDLLETLRLFAQTPQLTEQLRLASLSQQQVLALFETPLKSFAETGAATQLLKDIEQVAGPLTHAARWLITMIIWPVLIGVLGNLATTPVQEFLNHRSETSLTAATKSGPTVGPADYRFALSNGVRMRSLPSTQGKIVSHLRKGQVVRVLRSQQGWLFISLTVGDSETVGWTYSNTLGKFVAD